jgi:protein-L-isoaspartate O-methyltransferase
MQQLRRRSQLLLPVQQLPDSLRNLRVLQLQKQPVDVCMGDCRRKFTAKQPVDDIMVNSNATFSKKTI